MSRRKKADEPEGNGIAVQDPPGDAAEPAAAPSTAEPPKPLKVFSYQVGLDAYVQCAVWEYEVVRPNGTAFLNYDCTLRRRWRDPADGVWKTLTSFHVSEFYAVEHALRQAAAFIAEQRAAELPF